MQHLRLAPQDATPFFELKISIAGPAVARVIQMRVFGQNYQVAAARDFRVSARAHPPRIGRGTVEIGVRRDDNGVTFTFVFIETALANPRLTITSWVQKAILRNVDRNAFAFAGRVPTFAIPFCSINRAFKISIWGNSDLATGLSHLFEPAQTTPAFAKGIEVSALGDDNFYAVCFVGFFETMMATPAPAKGAIGSISILGDHNGDTLITVRPEGSITFPPVTVSLGMGVFRYQCGRGLGGSLGSESQHSQSQNQYY